MAEILLCIHDPMLVKNVHGMLLDDGYHVALSEYPAQAIQQILKGRYRAVVIDAQAFGMPAEDAVRIIKAVSPETRVIYIGCRGPETDGLSINVPPDLERLRTVVHAVHEFNAISYT